jgi:hypothetical protein
MRAHGRFNVVIVTAALAAGCALEPARRPDSPGATPQTAGVPSWAKHIKTTPVGTQTTFEQAARNIEGELQRAELVDFHMPAEQMALAALQGLEAGHRADAAVLLAIASYRYRQQAQHILDVGYHIPEGLPGRVNDSAYFRLVRAEEETYEHLTFNGELRVLAAWLRGEDAVELDADLVRRLGELLQGQPVDEETFREVMRQRPIAADASPETPEAAALADAFLARLRADAGDKRKRLLSAVWTMAETPLPAFQTEALRLAWLPVPPRFCSHIADQLGAHRAAVTALLTDANDATRAASAIVLGMNPAADQVVVLNRRWDAERQPLVRLALAYALARHGRHERVQDLVAALHPCAGDACLQAISLLEWLPRDILVNVSEDVPAAVASDTHQDWFTRMFAVATLGRMALEHPLSAKSRPALFAAARDRHEEMSRVAREVIAHDTGLARTEVLASLAGASPDYAPLLARLARVATAADLPLVAGLMPRFAGSDGPEAASLVEAAGAVPSPEAEAKLVAWFDAYPALRARITLRLLGRSPSSQQALDHIVAAGDRRTRLLVQLARRAPDAPKALALALRTSDPNERLFAAQLAGMVGDSSASAALWPLVKFANDRYYPQDALMRHEAMAALIRIALATHRPPPRPPKTMAAN